MSLEIKPNQEAKIAALAAKTGRDKSEILEEVIDSYFDELTDVGTDAMMTSRAGA
jgi:predicted DNA-binding protein